MKVAEIKKLKLEAAVPDLRDVSAKLDEQKERLLIDTINWKDFNYKPEVALSIAYSDREIFLKYYVKENYFKAEKIESNQMVCEDSCVEFFVSPEEDGIYYNLEFNGIGTCLMGSGTARENSTRVNPSVISKIRRLSSVGSEPVKEREGSFEWTITIAIPFEVFFHHNIKEIKGKTFRANFYKCGDMLKVPHYVTWNPVGTENPDYHQPVFFGLLRFI
ncbi:MAG TPA: carbohydrate-binding family 9-like protein [Bacteroidales bacterium]|nr:carbohydrate-binding family 9-like protein [Bacteroidales bacterium]HPT22025.1 carbohydrate-binding family 9-like protein [Bacteroidales bacterium]